LTSAETYLPMPTLSAGVLQRMSTRGTLVVDMGLDIPDADLRRRAQLNGPRLRDALRTALASYASTYYRDRTSPDPTQMTRLMQSAIDRTLGAGGAQVLLVNIIYQRAPS
ncbi:MAG: Tat pathway signal protein, partial [Phycisphaerales bacterium]|nr:Tat pathway signal protein [Hyphomonadaceae bacterium]